MPQDEQNLEAAAARYHSDEDWSFFAKDAPRSLRDTSPIRPSVKFNLKIPKASLEQGKRSMGRSQPPMPPPPYKGKGPPLGPHLEAYFLVLLDSEDEESPSWEPLPIKLVKELKQACASYGATAPYTLTLLDALAARWMTPYDWKTVAKACLSGGQYLLWRTEYEDLAHKQARDNCKHGPQHIVQEMLAGTDKFESARNQMNLDKKALEQVTTCALGAWRSLPQGKELTSSLSNIK